MFYANAMRGYGLGAKYGIVEGLHRYNHTTETPKMDDSAMQGAIGIIIAVGGVLIALYIIAVVVGSISYAVTSGNIRLSTTWNTTITKHVFSRKENLLMKIVCKNLTRQKRAEMHSKKQTDGYTWVNIDSQAQATFNLANVLPIAIIGVGTVLCESIKRLVYIAIYSYDCNWCLQRPGYLNPAQEPILKRTTNIAYA